MAQAPTAQIEGRAETGGLEEVEQLAGNLRRSAGRLRSASRELQRDAARLEEALSDQGIKIGVKFVGKPTAQGGAKDE